MRVDEPGQDGGANEIAGVDRRGSRGIGDRGYSTVVNGDRSPFDGRCGVGVEEPDIPQH